MDEEQLESLMAAILVSKGIRYGQAPYMAHEMREKVKAQFEERKAKEKREMQF